MKNFLLSLVAILTVMAMLLNCGKEAVQIDEDGELALETSDFDVYFELIEPFSETYMVFGGSQMRHKNSFSSIILSTISMEDARPIYANYPDFHKCASPGAALAKEAVGEMNIIPSDSSVLDSLKEVLSEHKASFKDGGDRVCVKLEGKMLEMTSVIVRKVDEDIIDQLPNQARDNYFLVESAEIVDAEASLNDS
jgi:hypothetical protein